MGVAPEAAQEELHLLVDHRVVRHEPGEVGLLLHALGSSPLSSR